MNGGGYSKLEEGITTALGKSDIEGLFLKVLAWDAAPPAEAFVTEAGRATCVATLAGVDIWVSKVHEAEDISGLEKLIAKRSSERLLVVDRGDRYEWRWPKARRSGNATVKVFSHSKGDRPQWLVQRLIPLRRNVMEELTVTDVVNRLRASFDADAVTAKFYSEFAEQQGSLALRIKGIGSESERAWYASLLLNRLMFVYFMQKKGFINDDVNYLRTSLQKVRNLKGRNSFYGFFKDFLIPLFHDGLGSESPFEVADELNLILGDVPYVNGGIFSPHALETANKIDVPDDVFEEIFTFFDGYRWHLDEREGSDGNEINPDVLGYIFEKFVNQKEQGAFYTKEDVTGYMTANAMMPVVIDRLEFKLGQGPWGLLLDNPRKYIPEALFFGEKYPVPITVLNADPMEFGPLDDLATDVVGLPGERWRETLERRDWAIELERRLVNGECLTTQKALTFNLDLVGLCVDWFQTFHDDEEVGSAWNTLTDLNVIDPTCGSGAFLFAALDILEELYDSLIDRAVNVCGTLSEKNSKKSMNIVAEMGRHTSREYFVLKLVILENLYGVDIMAEAVEIARLRLFLALVSKLQAKEEIEPLPDLDMNIKIGNILVGCSTIEDAKDKFSGDMMAMGTLETLEASSTKLASMYEHFVALQRSGESVDSIIVSKQQLVALSEDVREQLDRIYASDVGQSKNLEAWKSTHIPFHWFVEFPEAMQNGGFDVVIGNPPYIARKKITSYSFSGFKTDASYDIFAPCMERAASILCLDGGFSMIVPIALQFGEDYGNARGVLTELLPQRIVSTYSRNPASLFDASVGVRSTILVGRRGSSNFLATTALRRWISSYRPFLFQTSRFSCQTSVGDEAPWPRYGSDRLAEFSHQLSALTGSLGLSSLSRGHQVGFKAIPLYYLSVFLTDPPAWHLDGKRTPQTAVKHLSFATQEERDAAFVLMSGRLMYWWWAAVGDDVNLTKRTFESFPASLTLLKRIFPELMDMARLLDVELMRHPLVTKYAGKEMGNYDMSLCRHVTDRSDLLILRELGFEDYWPDILLADAKLAKVTAERPGTRREWPFPL
jgi:hypothetical protein